jgi:hypothetical protein
MKVNNKQLEKIKAAYKNVEQAQVSFNNYLKGVADAIGVDDSKQYNFDFETGEFKEVKNDTNSNVQD